MEEKFYTAASDHCFKIVFLNENNKGLLKDFLEDILDVKINKIELLRESLEKDNVRIKRGYLDCFIEIDDGIKIGIELNSSVNKYYRNKSVSYICDEYSHMYQVGENYLDKFKIIQINLTYHGALSEKIKSIYEIRNEEGISFVKNFQIIEYNMEKIEKVWYNEGDKEEKYRLLIMLNRNKEELKRLSKKDKRVERFMEEVVKVNKDPKFHVYMDEEAKRRAIMNTEKSISYNEGLELGHEQGVEQGIEQGLEQGKREIINNMLKQKISDDDIIKYTNVTNEYLMSLKEKLSKDNN